MNLSIRRAQPDDLDTVVAFGDALIQEDAGQRDPYNNKNWAIHEGHDYFRSMMADDNYLILLAEVETEDDGSPQPIGFLVGNLTPPRSIRPVSGAELHSMFVHQADRSLGAGSALVKRFADWANGHDVELVSVSSFASNIRAINFYQSLGFAPTSLSLEVGLGDLSFDRAAKAKQ